MRPFGENFGLKIVAVTLAVMTWFFVKTITSESRVIEDVPLEVRVKPGMSLIQSGANTVSVTLSGTREDVRQVQHGDLRAVLDLTREGTIGSNLTVQLSPKTVKPPPRVRVMGIVPSQVTVRIDQMVEKELPVQPQVTGEPMAGYSIERVLIHPQSIRMKGLKSQLDKLSGIETLPVDLTGRRASFREWVELAPLEPNAGPKDRRWVEVDVRLAETKAGEAATHTGGQGK
jgi:YbbR domain-containing protein